MEEEKAAAGSSEHDGFDRLQRAEHAWAKYAAFKEDPGQRCAECWLLSRFCGCGDRGALAVHLPVHVAVVMHYSELGRLRASNTAKLLLRFGAELLCWGVDGHDRRLRALLQEAAAARTADSCNYHGALVLFPASDACPAGELAAEYQRQRQTRPGCGTDKDRARGDEKSSRHMAPLEQQQPRPCIVVLDGGWRETRKMNQSIDPRILRCSLSSSSRCESKGTRKYRGQDERIQTAAAFIALLRELGEDPAKVEELHDELRRFTQAFERQLQGSGVSLESRVQHATITAAADKRDA